MKMKYINVMNIGLCRNPHKTMIISLKEVYCLELKMKHFQITVKFSEFNIEIKSQNLMIYLKILTIFCTRKPLVFFVYNQILVRYSTGKLEYMLFRNILLFSNSLI